MNRHKTLFILASVAVFGLLAAWFTPAQYKWFVFHSWQAGPYSKTILSGSTAPTPDWAIDMVIVSENNSVTFGNHEEPWLVAFSPSGKPNDKLIWSHVWGPWYVAELKHNKALVWDATPRCGSRPTA